MKLRKSSERGHANHGWLKSYHSFSFASYYDPAHMGYSVLRVINEDFVEPAKGFGMHSHRDMEIVTYMLKGAIRHEDSMGNSSVINAGDVQRMSAGTGVQHSEYNASNQDPSHFLQIWITPEIDGTSPSYEEKHFNAVSKTNQWCLIASHDAREGSLRIHQDVELFATILLAGHHITYMRKTGRSLYFQVVSGNISLNGVDLMAGDAMAVNNETPIEIMANDMAEIILFDLPSSNIHFNA